MPRRTTSATRALLGSLPLLLVLMACGSEPADDATGADHRGHGATHEQAARSADPCGPATGPDAAFWRTVADACDAGRGDERATARALRRVLEQRTPAQVAAFHRTLVAKNRALYTRAFVDAADDLCAPGLGLGDDLGTDYRTWIVFQGQPVYDHVVADPARLPDLGGARLGCGQGELDGYAALQVYDRLTGRSAAHDGLPALEPARPPAR